MNDQPGIQDKGGLRDPLVVQWLGLRAFTAEGLGSVPGRGTKILQAAQRGQKKKEERDDLWGRVGWDAGGAQRGCFIIIIIKMGEAASVPPYVPPTLPLSVLQTAQPPGLHLCAQGCLAIMTGGGWWWINTPAPYPWGCYFWTIFPACPCRTAPPVPCCEN